jgi:DNA-binding protein HU-beta
MNKGNLSDILTARLPVTTGQAMVAIDTILSAITDALLRGERVKLQDFGSFTPKEWQARDGRNPQTGETIRIATHKSVKFSVSKKLKEALNGGRFPDSQRYAAIAQMRTDGCTLQAIGDKFNLSRKRVRQILAGR